VKSGAKALEIARIFNRRFSRIWHWAAVACVILLFAFIRIRLQDFPLERDEGEYAYMGQLMLQGSPVPDRIQYEASRHLCRIRGNSGVFRPDGRGCPLGLILINSATTVLVYLLERASPGALRSRGLRQLFASVSGQAVLGISAHATHFVILPALAGILVLLRAAENRRLRSYLISGILMGLAFLMKQPGIFLALFAGG